MSTEISRREFLKLSEIGGLAIAALPITDRFPLSTLDKISEETESFPFINQKNKSQCAIASMTMLIASYFKRQGIKKDLDKLYNQTLEITTKITGRELKSDSMVGVYGNEIIKILDKSAENTNFTVKSDTPRPYSPEKMDYLLSKNGPAIIDVNVNYLANEDTNHWIVGIKVIKNNNKFFINLADPFRSEKKLPYLPLPGKNPENLMFKNDGTIILPWEVFNPSAGGDFIQLVPKDKRRIITATNF